MKAENASASLVGFGPGVVYYLMPANVSLGASLLLSKATVSQDDTTVGETELGLGGSLRVGKEWWLGSRTGLGVSGQLHLATMKDSAGDAGSIFATAFTLAGSFTYD